MQAAPLSFLVVALVSSTLASSAEGNSKNAQFHSEKFDNNLSGKGETIRISDNFEFDKNSGSSSELCIAGHDCLVQHEISGSQPELVTGIYAAIALATMIAATTTVCNLLGVRHRQGRTIKSPRRKLGTLKEALNST